MIDTKYNPLQRRHFRVCDANSVLNYYYTQKAALSYLRVLRQKSEGLTGLGVERYQEDADKWESIAS